VGYRDQSSQAGGHLSDGGPGPGDRKAFSPLQSVCVRACVAVLKGYKILISPWLPSACRFHPTCSVYMLQAIERHGVLKGVWLGIKRLGKCHPFHEGGVDLVPNPK
jgi:putative membrane protein insertion efficiency factor